ncbi:hypothetical protein SLS60_009839 [Paraconiothyrium brasiliense]|uniref:2EXR domain-containing protein n=1 Tax=Paraconiothyrium brasiliense TaxID=300254 RepID=A0ABR3QSN4_9PLEO
MSTAKQPVKPMHPLFLNLPGELRNRIYDLAATTDNATRLVKRTPSSAPSTYAALTRVCRQIREEYLPIQQHNAYLQVYFEELNDFICTFFNEDNPVRFLQIEFRRLHTTPEVEVELLPILRALANSMSISTWPGKWRSLVLSME